MIGTKDLEAVINMPLNLYFNDKPLPEYVRVKNIDIQLLPNEKNERKIIVDFFIYRKQLLDGEKINELIDWLLPNGDKEAKLILPNDLSHYYMAKVSNVVDLSGSIRKGTGSIEFTCSPAARTAINPTVVSFEKNATFYYLGTKPAKPKIKFVVKDKTSIIELSFSNARFNNSIKIIGDFAKDQVIVFDLKTMKVTVDEELNMNVLSLDSFPHELMKYENNYILTNGNCSVTVEFNEMYI